MGNHIASKSGSALVIDIPASSTHYPADIQVWHQNTPDTPNQLWDFAADAVVPGYFNIKSNLLGSPAIYIGMPVNWPASPHAIADRPLAVNDFFRWRFVQDPAGSGYCYLQNRAINLVLQLDGTPQQGAKLRVGDPVGRDDQLWKSAFPAATSVPSQLTWMNMGSGSGTALNGADKCSYDLNLQVKRDGSWRFWGQFSNHGDVPVLTAGAQDFGVAAVIHDLAPTWYSFSYGGYRVSAPAPDHADTVVWDVSGSSGPILENWTSIALAGRVTYSVHVETAESDDWGYRSNDGPIKDEMQAAATSAGAGKLALDADGFTYAANVIYYGYIDHSNGQVASGPSPGVAGGGGGTPYNYRGDGPPVGVPVPPQH